MLFLKKIYDFLVYILFEFIMSISVAKEHYTYIHCEPENSCASVLGIKESSSSVGENVDAIDSDKLSFLPKEESKVVSQFREKLEIDLSTPIEILEKMENLWFIFSVGLTEDEKIEIEDVAYAHGVYYTAWTTKDGNDELYIELFSLEKLEEIRKKNIPPQFPNTFRVVEEDEEEYHPPKKEERKPNYWYRNTDTNKEPFRGKNIKKKDDDGWTTVTKKK